MNTQELGDHCVWYKITYFITPQRKYSAQEDVSFSHHVLISPWKVKVEVTQLCPTLCDPMNYTVHGILQARILEQVAFPFSWGSSQPRDWAQVSHIAGRFFSVWATRKAQLGYLSAFNLWASFSISWASENFLESISTWFLFLLSEIIR